MEVRQPIWTLARPCPVCDQGSCLELLVCTACGVLCVACSEEGTLFPNPRDLSVRAVRPGGEVRCPSCSAALRAATGAEIQRAGIAVGDYE